MSFSRSFRPLQSVFYAIKEELKTFNLKPVKKIVVKFDPFHGSVNSARDFLFHTSTKKVQLSNPKCRVLTEIVNDRSEPTVKCDLNNGEKVVFKTAHLTTLELLKSYKAHVAVHEEIPKEDGSGSAIPKKLYRKF